MAGNLRLYPWFRFFQSLLFWQGVWFLFFQSRLTPAEAILLYAVYDIATTALEVPSGYLSDRVGRRLTLVLAAAANVAAMALIVTGGGFWVFAAAQVCLGAGIAFMSGTDSSLLYESLAAEGRGDEVEAQELLAWRAAFTGLALSALIGGVLAGQSALLPFAATGLAGLAGLVVALGFREPPHRLETEGGSGAATVRAMLANPVLAWLFVLSLVMYVFSHVPFVFGQPFILQALDAHGLAAEAPLVSGAVTAAMMLVSVATSWLARPLRRRIGLAPILLLALGMQVWLIGMLTLSAHPLVIGLLLLRMVPDSLAKPFITARIQPQLTDRRRATYLSLQSFVGRLVLAGSLIVLSADIGRGAALVHGEIRYILVFYLVAGLAVLFGLWLTRSALAEDKRDVSEPTG